jgi:N6-adenosine-specific RNA methylase IME4
VAYLRLPRPISWWNKVLKQGYNYHGGTTPGLWISHMQEETLVRQIPILWWNKVLKQGYNYHGGTTPGLWISHMQEEILVRQVPI